MVREGKEMIKGMGFERERRGVRDREMKYVVVYVEER